MELKFDIKNIALIILFVVAFIFLFMYERADSKKYRCSDFRTRGQAQIAYNGGATQLDGYDKDGFACENLPVGEIYGLK